MVSVGRVLMPPYMKEGAAGVAETIRTMTDELASMMYRTAASDVKGIDPSVIHQGWWL